MQDPISLNTNRRFAAVGAAAIVILLLVVSIVLFISLPDANAFNNRVEQIFVENDALRTPEAVRLLEVLAQSGTAFADVLQSYRMIIFILLVLSSALLISALYFLMTNMGMARRVGEIERSGLAISRLIVNRTERLVEINAHTFELTEAACETLAVLCEARMDDEVISGVEIEAVISGRAVADCDEAAGATRIKRLRDHLGNQLVSALLIKNVSRKGYILSIEKDVICVL